ncbi:hypothetical protein STRNTR1_1379 [Stenotrophomonas maltophilia]|nr:hypothetical protein STRNTR1_1379 [Stenotrophomonas maltophilia]
MRLTPLRSPSTRPRTGSVRVYPRRRKRRSKAGRGAALAREPSMAMPVVLTGTLRAVAMGDVGSGSCRCLRLYRKQ